ncbi:uncharacterized protein LOC112179877 [Rosa chinensis]|uniref:uncharacterized protein LOC112179877 n=1 Tax=Rosa chinensis TaxID=74649 RepID=UPI000D09495D|nr:uncharacterized protein LOC112179877 [Rosa chinensis]
MEIAMIMKTRSMAKDLSGTVREKLSVVCAINDEDSNDFQQEITDDDVEGMDELVRGGNLRRTSGLCSCSKSRSDHVLFALSKIKSNLESYRETRHCFCTLRLRFAVVCFIVFVHGVPFVSIGSSVKL